MVVIPFLGWVPVNFTLLRGDNHHFEIPFLITTLVNQPIIGFNVIEKYIKSGSSGDSEANLEFLQSGLPNIKTQTLSTLINLMSQERTFEVGNVLLGKHGVKVQKKSTQELKVITDGSAETRLLLFEPETELPEGLTITGSVL
ncbi:hypothetical protein SNE40_001614 [Patella caerulea]|uniref:Uncharacterized protein n=1 Tax=Patella caerulea TaxID=87958 RepID=A0AAN8Q3R2_PATCE